MSTLQPSPGPPSWHHITRSNLRQDDVIKWKHFPRNWPFARRIHRSLEFTAQRPVTRSFYVFFDLCPNKPLSKQCWGWWFEMPPGPLWSHCNGSTTWDRAHRHTHIYVYIIYGCAIPRPSRRDVTTSQGTRIAVPTTATRATCLIQQNYTKTGDTSVPK